MNGGILLVDFASELAPTSAVTVNGAGVFRLNTTTVVIGALTANGANVDLNGKTLTAGPVTLIDGYINFSTNNGNLVLSGDLTSGAASTTSVVFTSLNLGGAARTIDVADGVAPVDMEIQGTISGTGGITKTGAGTLRVLEASYTGLTTVNAGTLLLLDGGNSLSAVPGNLTVNGGTVRTMSNNQIANTALVTINAGGTLDLNGLTDTIGPMIVAGGTLTTGGATPGRLTVGNTSFNSGSTLAMNLVSPSASDRLIVNGVVALGGALQLTSTSSFAVGQTVTLIDNDGTDGVTGTFIESSTGRQSFDQRPIIYDQLHRRHRQRCGADASRNSASCHRYASKRWLEPALAGHESASHVQHAGDVRRRRRECLYTDAAGGGSVSFQASAIVIGGVTVVTLSNFTGPETDGFGSLNDGRYTLTALASQISANGVQLNNGTNYTLNDTQGLFRLFGDVNGDQTVNGFDLGFFRNAFGTQTGDSNYLSYLDLNGDGVINGFDLGQFRTRFGTMLP